MTNTITITEPQVDTLLGTYLGIQLERAATQGGPFSLVVQLPYVLHQTVYVYIDAAGGLTDWYRTARYTGTGLGPYSAAWSVQAQAGAGISLSQYRHRLAEAAGFNVITQATAGSARADQVICTAFQSTELEISFFGNTWLYEPSGPNANQVRRVQYNGLDPTTGTITLDRALSTQTPLGTALEIYGRLPPVKYEGRLGLNDLVNRTLSECWTIQKLPLAAVQNQRVYPVGALFPWLQAEDQLVEVYYRPANSDPNADDQLMMNWRWVSGGDNPGIEIAQTLNTGDILLPQAYVPMSWWIDTGTGFGLAPTEGLQAETDRALMPLLGMEIVGNAWVFGELGKWGLPDDQTNYRQQRAQARAAANQWKRLTLEHPKVRKQHWPAVLTVRSRDNFGYGHPVFSTPG